MAKESKTQQKKDSKSIHKSPYPEYKNCLPQIARLPKPIKPINTKK